MDEAFTARARTEILEELGGRRSTGTGGGPPGPPGPAGIGFTVYRENDTSLLLPNTDPSYVVFFGLTLDRTLTLPVAPVVGELVIVKDYDGSLATHNIIINGNGQLIDGAATYTMTLLESGLKGSVTVIYDGVNWGIT
jgi:hypothetical protein